MAAKPLHIYVSPQGNDAWDGRSATQGDNGHGPFQTIEHARDVVRGHMAQNQRGPITVWLRGGAYETAGTLTFTPQDSGTPEHPVLYTAFPGEQPVISGGRRISGWKKSTVNGKECWIADLPEVRSGAWNFTQLFVNNHRRHRSRLPKVGYYRFKSIFDQPDTGFDWEKGPDHAEYAEGDISPAWKNIADVKIVAQQLWFEMHFRIKSIDAAQRAVHFHARGLGSLVDEKKEFARYYVENAMEGLSEPGEWYLDRSTGTLYYLPMSDEDITTAEAIAPVLEKVLHLAGTDTESVHHLWFENIRFEHTEWTPPAQWCGSVQAAFDVPGALLLDRADHCVLYGCSVQHVAQYAIEVARGSYSNRIVACELTDMGAGGVRVNHEWMKSRSATSRDEIPATVRPGATTIADCHIHHGTCIYHSAIGVFIGNSGKNRVVHNHIHDMHYTGISVGWSWGYDDQATIDNRIEHNHIHHINWEKYFSDNGAIYTLGVQPGTVIRNNLLHHISSYGYGGEGIYPDEGSSDMVIENNIAYCARHSGYSGHYTRDLVVRNNIFALSELDPMSPAHRYEAHRSGIFERNIVYWRQGIMGVNRYAAKGWNTRNVLIRDNLFWACGRPVVFEDKTDLAYWQKAGQFSNTVIADPLFVAPESGDFTLREDSPAHTLAFKPIDMTSVGPRMRLDRPAHFVDRRPDDFPAKPIVRTFLEWVEPDTVRVTVKNVGDLPASGGMELKADPAGLEIERGSHLAFRDLQPQTERIFDVQVQFPAQMPENGLEFSIESAPFGDVVIPGLLWVRIAPDWRIVTLPSLPKELDLTTAPSIGAPRSFLQTNGEKCGDFLLASCKEGILVQATLRGATVGTLDTKDPWKSSGIEFFAAAKPTGNQADIAQIFVAPDSSAGSVKVLSRKVDTWELLASAKASFVKTGEGLALRALLPLSELRLVAGAKEMLLEVVGHVYTGGPDTYQRATLFGTRKPWTSTEWMGKVLL
jgi:hypothetical protein